MVSIIKIVWITIAPLIAFLNCRAQSIFQIDSVVQSEIDAQQIVGITVGVIQSGEIVHLKSYGYADLSNRKAATIHTSFPIASVSKTIICTAIFKLIEQGVVQLHHDVNAYLPFRISNPNFSNGKITIEQLLNHRSGINDGNAMKYWSYEEPDVSLTEFLRNYLTPEGRLNSKTRFMSDTTSYRYSNIGYGLLGLIIETMSQQTLENYCSSEIFTPLQMSNTSWLTKKLDQEEIAKPHQKGNKFKGFLTYPYYPAGQLKTSISDFTRFIQVYLSDNEDFPIKIATRRAITPDPTGLDVRYFTWRLDSTFSKNAYYAHSGGEPGVRSWALIDVTRKNAMVVFANSEVTLNPIIVGIDKLIFDEEKK